MKRNNTNHKHSNNDDDDPITPSSSSGQHDEEKRLNNSMELIETTTMNTNGTICSTTTATTAGTGTAIIDEEQHRISHSYDEDESSTNITTAKKILNMGLGRGFNPSTFNYRPVVQTNFDMDPLVTTTVPIENTKVTQVGTIHSRKGKYVRQTWRQTLHNFTRNKRSLSLWLIGLFLSLVLLTKVSEHYHSSDNDTTNYSKHGGDYDSTTTTTATTTTNNNNSNNHLDNIDQQSLYDDDTYINNNDIYQNTIYNNNNYNSNNPNNDWKDLRINDYTEFDFNSKLNGILLRPSQSTQQNNILKKIPKACLQQDFVQRQQQQQNHNINIRASSRSSSSCNPKCSISNPFIGEDKLKSNVWTKALQRNIQLVDEYILEKNTRDIYDNFEQQHHGSESKKRGSSSSSSNNIKNRLDVVFYGDSIIEEWNGRWMGYDMESKQTIKKVFQTYFHSTNNNNNDNTNKKNNQQQYTTTETLNGLALGIAGDKTTNLLWRIQNGGELKKELNPKVFWLVIGTNDLTDNCSEDVVILGILSIVKELREQRPDSIVVINGLLPRTDRKDGRLIGDSGGFGSSDGYDNEYDDNETDDIIAYSENESRNGTSLEEEEGDDTRSSSSLSFQTDDNHRHRNNDRKRRNSNSKKQKEVDMIFDYWPSIQAINHQLKLYARKHEKVEFYDPSHLFLASLGNDYLKRNEYFLMKELQDDYLHPTALGHKIWAEAIVDYFASDLDAPDNL